MDRLLRILGLVLLMATSLGELVVPDTQPSSSVCQRRRTPRARRVRRRPARARVTAAQRRQIRRWHVRADRSVLQAWMRQEPQPLVFRPIARFPRAELIPQQDGTFDAAALSLAEQAFAYRDDGTTHAIHPRLLELVYRAVRHFHAPYVHVVSGYRSGRPGSRHAQGRAVDMVLPGVTDRRLASYLRPQGFVGVGIYPASGFVHLDVRARSYFWSDSSGPGQSNRERQIMRTLGPRFDRIARALGAVPTPEATPEATHDPMPEATHELELNDESDETLAYDEESRTEDAGLLGEVSVDAGVLPDR